MSFGSQTLFVGISSPICCQDAAHGSSSNMQSAGDFGFANAGTLELSYLVGVEGRRQWPAQALAVLAGMGQAGPNSFPQNLPFERGENGQQGGHGSTGGCRQIQRLRQ